MFHIVSCSLFSRLSSFGDVKFAERSLDFGFNVQINLYLDHTTDLEQICNKNSALLMRDCSSTLLLRGFLATILRPFWTVSTSDDINWNQHRIIYVTGFEKLSIRVALFLYCCNKMLPFFCVTAVYIFDTTDVIIPPSEERRAAVVMLVSCWCSSVRLQQLGHVHPITWLLTYGHYWNLVDKFPI